MIVLPMAGLSRRFFDAGYDRPKYMLDLHGRPVFDYVLRSFASRFGIEPLLIVLRPQFEAEAFVRARLAANGVAATLVLLDEPTRGQAETVQLGLKSADVPAQSPLTVFNIDSFRPGFEMSHCEYAADGFLEVFLGSGADWSFVKPAGSETTAGRAAKVAEKQRISDLSCTGLYYFATRSLFEEAYAQELAAPSQILAEHFIAPIYNQMIDRGREVLFRLVPNEDVTFCGVPEEYEALQQNPAPLNRFRFSQAF